MRFKISFLVVSVLGVVALVMVTCGPGYTPSSVSNGTVVPTATAEFSAFKIINDITGAGSAVTEVSFYTYPSGTSYPYYPDVASGATTLINLVIPAGQYFLYIQDATGSKDEWAPFSFTLGVTYTCSLSNSTGTINSIDSISTPGI